ncbi:hypothetical protein PAMP_009760 [Pampus punctatissimus]
MTDVSLNPSLPVRINSLPDTSISLFPQFSTRPPLKLLICARLTHRLSDKSTLGGEKHHTLFSLLTSNYETVAKRLQGRGVGERASPPLLTVTMYGLRHIMPPNTLNTLIPVHQSRRQTDTPKFGHRSGSDTKFRYFQRSPAVLWIVVASQS